MDSNKGKTGVSSIRIGGMTIDSLPIAEAAITKQQWPNILKSAQSNAIDNIKAKYPTQTVAWVNGAIKECNDSIKRVRALAVSQQAMIDEYLGHISLCDYRDKEIARLTDSTEDADSLKAAIKDLKLRFPPYSVTAMKQQITQCKEAMERCNEVIDKEYDSISTLRELLVNCNRRDNELREIGAKV